MRIVILGCGQIGSRHLQSLAQFEGRAEIFIINPSESALEAAKSRFEAVLAAGAADRLQLRIAELSDIPNKTDVVIVASNAQERGNLVRDLLEQTTPKHLILEKFLFQSLGEYDLIEKFLKEKGVTTWVNQWFSSAFAFREMAQKIARSDARYTMDVSGNGWGLGCNGIHFVELFDYLNGRTGLKLVTADFDDGMVEGKRVESFELTGRLTLQSGNGARLTLDSTRAAEDGRIHTFIKCGSNTVKVTLDGFGLFCNYDIEGVLSEDEYVIPMQSAMTAPIVQNLMLTQECTLPTYAASAVQHKILLKAFDTHFKENCGWPNKNSPIT